MTPDVGVDITDLRAALDSSDYACPGEHRLDRQPGDEGDIWMLLMDERGLPEAWGEEDLRRENYQLWDRVGREVAERWVARGECQKTLILEMEYDGDEYTSFCYPVASGDCAVALGIDCDEDYSHSIWAVFNERRGLAAILHAALQAHDAQIRDLVRLETAR